MKKKIKDLTLEECQKICDNHSYFHCDGCPLIDCEHHKNYSYYKNKHPEEREVEVDE